MTDKMGEKELLEAIMNQQWDVFLDYLEPEIIKERRIPTITYEYEWEGEYETDARHTYPNRENLIHAVIKQYFGEEFPDSKMPSLVKSHDEEAGTYYFQFTGNPVAKTTVEVDDLVNIDWDAQDKVVGLELLMPDSEQSEARQPNVDEVTVYPSGHEPELVAKYESGEQADEVDEELLHRATMSLIKWFHEHREQWEKNELVVSANELVEKILLQSKPNVDEVDEELIQLIEDEIEREKSYQRNSASRIVAKLNAEKIQKVERIKQLLQSRPVVTRDWKGEYFKLRAKLKELGIEVKE